ncbi:MAG: hypothetical protein MPJ04_08245 [Nitrosopumilus sp.]|nr:hypothetical protein [Nitrosopumilus sp.]MDA7945750.1 hypothetical protein [Nitrosopumilus sp.]MDA7955562.1 hypothetical protein [Nitrosopumilus sp.]MDA7974415.1 hypothetical protein [Nitrosopumilus sp.]
MPRFSVSYDAGGDPAAVFASISDYAGFPDAAPEFFPYVRRLSSRGGTSVAEERVRIGGREMHVTAKHVIGEMSHEIYFVGGDARGTRITMRVTGAGVVEMDADIRHRLMRAGPARRDCLRLLELVS